MSATLQELAAAINARVIGPAEATVSSVASITHASRHDLVFCENEKFLGEALASDAGAVVAGEFAAATERTKPLLIAKQPRLAFALAARHLKPSRRKGGIVHQTAIVPPTAVFGSDIMVGAYVVLGEHASIGDRVTIGAGCSIGSNVIIGHDCHIHSRVTIYNNTMIGSHCIIHAGAVLGADGFGYVRDAETGRYYQMPQIGRLIVGDHVEIGANVTIDRGGLEDTVIGEGTKLDNLVHIGHNCTLGENVVIAAQTGISGSSAIGDNAVIGGQVGIGEHVTLEQGTMLGGQSGVLSNKVFREKGPCFGTPARPLNDFLREQAALGRIARRQD
ncbi:MAG TPA: UDP-3-O-(3-hydroxymyristoyl)glucosamine N-acyltransferase [Candidatus Koribacter sp.]|jgi:UDP-3-O-[3-hydroxymyristoyl] glucosamine N-acyltransferase